VRERKKRWGPDERLPNNLTRDATCRKMGPIDEKKKTFERPTERISKKMALYRERCKQTRLVKGGTREIVRLPQELQKTTKFGGHSRAYA